MAVEYDISSDVAVIKETGSVSQCARVTQMYSGQITYDDEAGSKFATATINGKSQRVMLCIAVNGTVTYDDVPSLYSTVDGHRCLNIVTPTETGTPDDVPSLYETVVIDGQNVRAVRCIMINKTPVYDGVSSVCTFTGDDGKTHTAQLVNKVTGGSVQVIIKGTSPLNLPDAIANSLSYVKAFGGTEQRNLPDGYTELEYIEGTGTQYINTGISAPDGFVVDTNVEFTDMTKADTIIGEEDNSSGAYVRRNFIKVQDNRWLLGMYSHTWGQAAAVNTKYHIVGSTIKNNGYIDANGSRVASMTTTGELSDNPLLLFTTSWELLSNDNCAHMKMYDVKIWDANNTLVRDMFPVRRSSDNAVGMYDTVSGQFFTNAGTGTFVAGGAAVPTPDAPMDIVSNNGVLKFNRVFKSFNGNIGSTGVVGAATSFLLHIAKVEPGKTYKVNNVSLYGFFTTEPEIGSVTYNESKTVSSVTTITVPNDNNIKYIGFRNTADGVLYSDDEPIYADGTVETINVYGKNLCNKNDTESIGGWYNASYKIAVSGTNQTIVMRAQPGATYYYKHCSVTGGGRAFYTEVEDWDVGSDCSVMSGAPLIDKDTVRSITVSENAKWVFFNYGRAGQTATFEEQLADFMVSLTPLTSDTQYVPYYDGGTATAEMLLKVGDYQDVQSIIDGVVTKNIGIKVLDGTESWGTQTSAGVTWYQAVLLDNGASSNLVCTHFINARVQLNDNAVDNNGSVLRVRYDTVGDASAFSAYLIAQYNAGHPVIVLYALATPTTESVAGQALQVTGGDNMLEITQASLTGLELEAEYSAAVSLTIQEVQDANLDNNVEVTIS